MIKLAKLDAIQNRFCMKCTSNKINYGLESDCNTCDIKATLNSAPLVDAIPSKTVREMLEVEVMKAVKGTIPVEQVARILTSKIDECPRYCCFGNKMDLWCHEHTYVDKFHDEYNCCVDEYDCWLHAIKEGWLE